MIPPAEILGPQGRIAARLPNYEHRDEQLAMADAVAAAIEKRHHLVVEAGTGVGKSFAYLVPAILATDEKPQGDDEEAGRPRVVISTHTISLQEQLLSKDLPLLRSVMPTEFTAVLVKGRHNYLSIRRMKNALGRAASLFSEEEEYEQLRQIQAWSRDTKDGSLSDLSFKPSPAVWEEVASDTANCMGRECPHHAACFYYQARRRMGHAQILVVNHALYFTDLALRKQGVGMLPRHDIESSTRPIRWNRLPAITSAFDLPIARLISPCGGSTTSGRTRACWLGPEAARPRTRSPTATIARGSISRTLVPGCLNRKTATAACGNRGSWRTRSARV